MTRPRVVASPAPASASGDVAPRPSTSPSDAVKRGDDFASSNEASCEVASLLPLQGVAPTSASAAAMEGDFAASNEAPGASLLSVHAVPPATMPLHLHACVAVASSAPAVASLLPVPSLAPATSPAPSRRCCSRQLVSTPARDLALRESSSVAHVDASTTVTSRPVVSRLVLRGDDATSSSPRTRRSAANVATLPCLALFTLALGCGAPPTGVRAEPGSLVFTPAAERLELRLMNHGEAPVPLTRIRFDTRTPDWAAFSIENREYPREIAAGGAVSLRLRVDRDHFDRAGASRSGSARLLFAAGEAPQIVELRYEVPDLASDLRRAAIRTAMMLALVALAWASTRRTRLTWTTWLPVLAVLALFPFGPGLCLGGVGRSLSLADVEQCAAGRGGVPLALVAVGEGWLLYLLALVLAGLGRLLDRAALARRLASRDLALAAAFAGPLLAFGTLDPRRLVGEQAAGLVGGAAIPPAWGIFVQPIAAAVALAVAAAPPTGRLERLAFAAAFVACFLGGGGLPAATLAGTGHGLVLFIGAVVAAAKIAAVVWFVQRLHASPTGSRARAALFFLERAAMPLAIANLLVTSAYALLR